jgi:hypothetical protein
MVENRSVRVETVAIMKCTAVESVAIMKCTSAQKV